MQRAYEKPACFQKLCSAVHSRFSWKREGRAAAK
jgi:hypothetical protein